MPNTFFRYKQNPSNKVCKMLKLHLDKSNPYLTLTTEEAKRLVKLEAIAYKLKRGENVQNHQL